MVTPSALAIETLRAASAEHRKHVRESLGENWSPDIARYIRNLDPPLDFPIAWCAAFVQYCSDVAAHALQCPNPLDQILREAYVSDYYIWARDYRLLVRPPQPPLPGDLVLFSFGGKRYDHVGIILGGPRADGRFVTIEGNTSDPGDPNNPKREREGGGLYRKFRRPDRFQFQVVRWTPEVYS